MNILLTGYTGNIGHELARQLSGYRVYALVRRKDQAPELPGVTLVEGTLEELPKELALEIQVVLHSAASTAFKAPYEELRRVNVEGTERLLAFARTCPRLVRFVHLSTTCVCGDCEGSIPEIPLRQRPGFVNAYERSKWEAEQVVLDSGLPVEIARLSIVAGSERDGSVRRPGALHGTLFWLFKGLVPMVPGTVESRVDLISTEFTAEALSSLLRTKPEPGRVVHISAGDNAPRLPELVDLLTGIFARHHRAWSTGAIAKPEIVDSETFALFEASVKQSGDPLFRRVYDDARTFFPTLLHPRVAETSFVRALPLPNWRQLTESVFTWLLQNDWGRKSKPTESCHVIA